MTLLHEEIDHILKPRGAFLRQLGTDADAKTKNPALRLPDGELVGDVKVNSARNYTRDDFGNHVFPSDEVIVRLGVWAGLPFIRTTNLVVKGRWERYFKDYVSGTSLFEELRSNRARAQNLSPMFAKKWLRRSDTTPPTEWVRKIYHLFDRYFGISESGYGLEDFTQLCEELVHGYLHLFGSDDPAMARFIETHADRRAQLAAATQTEQAEFERCNRTWHARNTDLGEQLYEQQQLLGRQARDELQYLDVFGDLLVPANEARHAVASLQRQVEYKRTEPRLSRDEVEELDRQAQGREQEERDLARLRADIARAKFRLKLNGRELTAEQAIGMQASIKKSLRKIFMGTAPDRTMGAGFTEEQLNRLRGFFDDAQKLWELEAPFQPDPAEVQYILESVQALWESAGLDVNVVFQIPAELSLADKIAWLKRRTAWIDEKLVALKNEYTALYNDPEWREQQDALAKSESIQRTRSDLEASIAHYRAQQEALERELDTLFAEAA